MEIGINKYSVAWFKLAEFVMRREKEKALGIFKLLSHSLDDKGLIFQLEGDIFLSFSDIESAKKSYLQAAQLYITNNKFLPAAAIYEHLITLDPNSTFEYSFKMFQLYSKIGNLLKSRNAIKFLIESLSLNNNIYKLGEYIRKITSNLKECMHLYESIFIEIVKFRKIQNSYLLKYVEEIVDGLKVADPKHLEKFCKKIECLDQSIYDHALSYLLNNQ